jgi:hypothetical protein
LALGKISDSSYIPAGLTKAQYESIRQAEKAKKDANYQKNVAKAGKFIDFTDFYKQRGTELDQGWVKSPTKGHLMAKTKYDWSGQKPDAPLWSGVKATEAAAAAAKNAAKKK